MRPPSIQSSMEAPNSGDVSYVISGVEYATQPLRLPAMQAQATGHWFCIQKIIPTGCQTDSMRYMWGS